MPKSTLESWLRADKAGKLTEIGSDRRPLTEVEQELSRLKRELHRARQECEILKKAAAYFARESQPGTR
nr:transposase [Desulfurispirillum indicum]